MNKRALMMTAAAMALLSGPAFAQTSITTATTTPVSTSSDGTITIQTDGTIIVSTNPATAPAVTINGGKTAGTGADVLNDGGIGYPNVSGVTTPLTGIALITGTTGGFDNGTSGVINLTGSGTNKAGILISGPASDFNSGTFLGDITATSGTIIGPCAGQTNPCIDGGTLLADDASITQYNPANNAAVLFELGSTLKIQGDNSYGIELVQGASLGSATSPSDIDIMGTLQMAPTSSTSNGAENGIYVGGTMYGNINIIDGTITEQGNSTYGINVVSPVTSTSSSTPSIPGGIIYGNLNIDGTLTLTPMSDSSTTSSGNIGVFIGGTVASNSSTGVGGDINIGTLGAISSTGANAEGMEIIGDVSGFLENQGTLETIGTPSPATTGNPEAGSALLIGSSIPGGIYNAGPANIQGDTTPAATISALSTQPAIFFNPGFNTTVTTPPSVTIGIFNNANGVSGSFVNRGSISAAAENPDDSVTAFETEGISPTETTTFQGQFYNSGNITADARGDTGAASEGATALDINDYSSIPLLTNTVETGQGAAAPGSGTIEASVSTQEGGFATAILIHATSVKAGSFGSLTEIDNTGTIEASVETSNTTLLKNPGLPSPIQAIAIYDLSGTLTTINNSGVIIATATTLQDNSQVTQAINVAANTSGVTVNDDNGTIEGDILFGSGADTLNVAGSFSAPGTVAAGTIDFGGTESASAANDTLTIGAFGTVTAYLSESSGLLDISVTGGGILEMLAAPVIGLNPPVVAGTPLNAGMVHIGANSKLGITVSQEFNTRVFPFVSIINAETGVQIDDTASVLVNYGSFISSPNGEAAVFGLVSTPGTFTMSPSELQTISNGVTIPYLYTGGICTWNINGASTCTGTNPEPGDSVLELSLTPKTVGAQGCATTTSLNCNPTEIPLGGNAAKIFPYANAALANDPTLGSALVSTVSDATQANAAYGNFVPDVSGASRALAISLTDQASNVVAARQSVLREYANQEGDTTLWGQQFVQRLAQPETAGTSPGYVDTGFGFTLGTDDGDAVDGRYGGAFTFFSGDASEQDPQTAKTTSEWYLLTGYTDWRGRGLFLDTQASAGYVNLKGYRSISFSLPDGLAVTRIATEQHPGALLAGGATTGAIYNLDGTVITPEVAIDGLAMREDGYSEGGGGNGFNLRVDSSYEDSLRAFTGVDVREDLNFDDFLLQPEIRAGYRYDFANGAQSLHANFESIERNASSIFDITGPNPDKGNVVAGGGLAVSTGAWSIGASFNYLHANSGNTAESGMLTLLGRI